MDDPGSAQSVHHEKYSQVKLGRDEWNQVGKILAKHKARLSIGYVSGWVDDGNPDRGSLTVNGKAVVREPGRIYASPEVRYEKRDGDNTKTYDYQDEYQGIQTLRNADLVEVELHGHTHIHPDRKKWLKASDRYSSSRWYREFNKEAVGFLQTLSPEKHPLFKGLRAFRSIFGISPSTLICPGEEFTEEVLEKALAQGLNMVSSYYQCIRIDQRLCWAQHVCAPYLDKPDVAWLDSELPVIGYFHDFDLTKNGMKWFDKNLCDWEMAGIKHFITLKDMTDVLQSNFQIEIDGTKEQITMQGLANDPSTLFSGREPGADQPYSKRVHAAKLKITP
jgi:hypothetical protein